MKNRSWRYFRDSRSLFTAILKGVLLVAVFVMPGCGYRLSGGEYNSSILHDRTIAVPLFKNAALRPNLETFLTAALRDVIAQRGCSTAPDDSAELLLTGKVLSYSSNAVSYTPDDRIREYRAAITIEATLQAREGGTVLWRGTLSGGQDYPAMEFPLNNPALSEPLGPATRIALQQNNEEAAIREVARRLAEQLFDRVTGNF
ncbi:LptE family protein [Geobacter sp. DSM 9736]|uniref:LPS assembly lipoprotein LptE n=1 Tax=Geobacter sp. DSM 9736 TaxID=1277350 RepID=UPI000B501F34|nr:LptE family protein [Geobacter sp. DSM 9736]SNB45098.1 Lipopolysaccharide-assembly [Geobacter sp. DSM 9736]